MSRHERFNFLELLRTSSGARFLKVIIIHLVIDILPIIYVSENNSLTQLCELKFLQLSHDSKRHSLS